MLTLPRDGSAAIGELHERRGESTPPSTPPAGTLATLAVGWLILTITYAVALTGFTRRSLGYALGQGTITITLAALLGYGIWLLSGRIDWPERRRVRFILWQFGLAGTYAAIWVALDLVFTILIRGIDPGPALSGMNFSSLGLDWALGVLLYGLIMGACYNVRAQRRYRAQAAAAARAEALAARAQLDVLRAQLNPHFLFNALHSLGPLVRESPALAEDALNRLGDLLRYALDDGMSGDVAFADEWQFAQDYLALETLRLGARLSVRTEVDPEVLDLRIPSFTVQPMVENAIRHGIAPRPRGGTVAIKAAMEDSRLMISVSDDGVGTSPDALEQATGLGLRALRQRLAVRYHGAATVTIDTRSGQGFAVRLALPISALDAP
jgi:two-component system LytT family sensor kinase